MLAGWQGRSRSGIELGASFEKLQWKVEQNACWFLSDDLSCGIAIGTCTWHNMAQYEGFYAKSHTPQRLILGRHDRVDGSPENLGLHLAPSLKRH